MIVGWRGVAMNLRWSGGCALERPLRGINLQIRKESVPYFPNIGRGV